MAVDTSREKIDLSSSMLAEGYLVRLRVTGRSMFPFVRTGSFVTLARVPLEELRIGDIILCRCGDGSYKLHRLISMNNGMLTTMGDALCCPDAPFRAGDYRGKVLRIEEPDSRGPLQRNLELRSARLINYGIAVAHRMKLHLVCRALGLTTAPAL